MTSTMHPLATKRGAGAMSWCITAFRVWDGLTRAQRRTLLSGDVANSHPRVRAALIAAGCANDDGLTRWGQWVAHVKDPALYSDLFTFSDEGELMWRKEETCA